MPTLYRWTFDNQPAGTTPNPANSDDNGDPAWNIAQATATATFVYSTDHPLLGSGGVKITCAVNETAIMRAPLVTANNSYAMQINGLYLTAYPTADIAIGQWRSTATVCTWQLSTTGKLYLIDNAAGTQLTMTNALPLATQLLVDGYANLAGGVGASTFKHRVKNIATNTVLEEKTSAAMNLGTGLFQTGQMGKVSSGGAISSMYVDNLAVWDGASDYILPNSVVLGATLTVLPTSGYSPLTVTATAGSTGGTGTPVNYTYDFGDGSPIVGPTTSTSVQHTYTSSTAQDFTVTLTAVNT